MKLSAVATAVTCALVLATGGCSAPPEGQGSDDVADAPKRQAPATAYQRVVLDTDAGGFWFEPARCSIYQEDGVPMYDIAGAGKSPDGQPIYVTMEDEDGDASTGADIRIHVGVDAAFKHGDPVWISNDQQSHALRVDASQTDIDGQTLITSGVMFGKDHGGQLEVTRPIRVDCNR